jgi:hypothetical protein
METKDKLQINMIPKEDWIKKHYGLILTPNHKKVTTTITALKQ